MESDAHIISFSQVGNGGGDYVKIPHSNVSYGGKKMNKKVISHFKFRTRLTTTVQQPKLPSYCFKIFPFVEPPVLCPPVVKSDPNSVKKFTISLPPQMVTRRYK